ncbi:signal recognition particle-docking protein FtsY [Lentilactobacillus raoultii]|uniref:Signal recognition particle receptor FtsY n=1 Tax=Lentilactobacillus raoultii TaxID=1987503 RepID=A0ABW3PI54_9LACO|nr:signal recognition particle-docking protein FtsY [Lentilactobacillus raoultii]
MGLFDIFKRRSKKNKEKEIEKKKAQAETESTSQQAAQASTTVEQSQTSTPEKPLDHSQEAESGKVASKEASESAETSAEQSESQQPASNETTEPVQSKEVPNKAISKDSSATEAPQNEPKESTQEAAENLTQPAKPTVKDSAVSDTTAPSQKETGQEEVQAETSAETTQSYEKGLAKSRSSFGQKLNALLANFRHVDESFFDDLEDMLIESDVGFEMSMKIADELRQEVKLQNAKKPKDVQNVIVEKMTEMYDQAGNGENSTIQMAEKGPTVILMVGVNGVGKTTTIGKMAKMYKDQGKKVILAAADTFRAGAIEQLNVWAQRDGVDIVKSAPKSDPSSVVFDAVKKARDENYDVLMVDTAGRLQNKVNLMNELSKMKKVLTREIPEAPHEVLLVLDATTGQNALTQAKTFKEATDVTGIVLTKLDGTARGGIVLAIRSELHLPVKYVGLGEKVTDLKPFDPNDFVYGLFKGLISE